MESSVLAIALLLIAVVLFFDFINGFNDGANMMVTPVITGALEPRRALLLIAVFEFVGAWFLGTAVAQTLGKGIVNPKNITVVVVFAARRGVCCLEPGGLVFRHAIQLFPCPNGGLLGAVALDSGLKWIHWGKVGQVLAILIITRIPGLGRRPVRYPKNSYHFQRF